MINKSNENISLEDALENMELLINAEHGFPFEEYGKRQTDIVSFQLQADENGNVSLAEVNTAYNEMINQVREAYNNTGFAEKGLILVTLSINETDKSGTTINATVTTGNATEPDTDIFTDCWYYGEDMGKCDGTFVFEKDGGDAIAEEIIENAPILPLDCPGPPSEWRHFTDPQTVIILEGNEYTDEQGDYLMFFYPDEEGDGFTDEEKQLSADDMNYYYDNEYEVIYNIVPNDPDYNSYTFPTYVLIGCVIKGEQFNDPDNDETLTLHHENNLTYAHRYWVHTEILPKPTPID